MIRLPWSLVGLLALGAGLELGTRVDERVRLGTPIASAAASVADIITITGEGARGVAGGHYRQFSINSLGLRGPEIVGDRPRLLVLGASETFGLYEAAGKEYPQQLQDSLAAAGCIVDVLNAGLPGFSLPTLAVTYRHRLRQLGATSVVLYPTPVQYLEMSRPAFRPPTGVNPERSLRPRLRFFRRLRDHLKTVLPARIKTYLRTREITAQRAGLGDTPQWTVVPADRLRAYQDDIGSFLDTLAADNVATLFVTHANRFGASVPIDTAMLVAWAKFYPRAALDLLPKFETAANAAGSSIAAARRVPVSDLATALRPLNPDSVFADFSHFTTFGAGKVAGLLARDLLRTSGCPTDARPATVSGQ